MCGSVLAACTVWAATTLVALPDATRETDSPRRQTDLPAGVCCVQYACLPGLSDSECFALGGEWFPGFDCRDFLCPLGLTGVPERCDTAYTVANLPFSVTFHNYAAQGDGPPGSCNASAASTLANDVWFTWIAVADATLRLSVQYAYDGITIIYEGSDCAGLTELTCLNSSNNLGQDSDELTFQTTSGRRYWIQIGDWGTNPGGGRTFVWLRPLVAACPGDMNCDSEVTFADIDSFVEALAGSTHWTDPSCSWSNGDCNGDGDVTFADIDAFVARIGTTCPR